MKKLVIVLSTFLVIILTVASGCGVNRSRENSENTIVITGSTTVFPIAQRAAEEFMKSNPNVNISVRGTGSGNGIASLINGTCDIADASRPMSQGEIKRAEAHGIKPVAHVIAKDAIAIIVNKNNPLKSISHRQLKEIYTGEITNWKEIGGPDMKIVPITRDSSSGTFEIFEKRVLGEGVQMVSSAVVQGSNQAVKVTVGKTPGAIGYVGLGYVDNSVKALKYDGVSPSKKSVLNGSYEISRPLFMYTNGEPKGIVKKFIDFIMSDKGQKIVGEVGFIPLKP